MRIAIDGPAGSGKSTVAKEISKRLKIPYLESGLAYRAFAHLLIEKRGKVSSVSWEDLEGLFELIEINPMVGFTEVRVEGRRVEDLVSEEVGRVASLIGEVPEFRERINEVFRKVIGKGEVVVEGRDAGTHIIPDADFKFFLTASPEERARRRVEQLKARGVQVDYESVLKEIIERDKRDMERKRYPFRPAKDAILIDTSGKSVEEVIGEILSIVGHGKGP